MRLSRGYSPVTLIDHHDEELLLIRHDLTFELFVRLQHAAFYQSQIGHAKFCEWDLYCSLLSTSKLCSHNTSVYDSCGNQRQGTTSVPQRNYANCVELVNEDVHRSANMLSTEDSVLWALEAKSSMAFWTIKKMFCQISALQYQKHTLLFAAD